MAPGTYREENIRIDATTTMASELLIHGGGAHLTGTQYETLLSVALPITIRDLQITYPGTSLILSRPARLERVRITAGSGVTMNSQIEMHEVEIEATSDTAIFIQNGSLVLDRAVLRGGQRAINASTGSTVEITNLLAYGQAQVALDLPYASGAIQFSTIASSGTATTSSPRGIRCSLGITIRSSIVWTPAGTPLDVNCTLVDVIAGPASVSGASNANPMFVNGYHLGPNSPAKDAVDVGPALDYEGEPRPRGARYDIGADETD